ncbi:hypothetical protein Asp14428_73670 [Actinoplanes sp. NBRC 14428]|nr:hypothetical protein Asp14428_73670 [Actinoplanes sp. NBRC 14428]
MNETHTEEVRLTYRTPGREAGEVAAAAGPWSERRPGLVERTLSAGTGEVLMVQRAAAGGTGSRWLAHLLVENEIRAGLRLLRSAAGGHVPYMPRLVGYDLDAAEPFVLTEPPRGRSAGEFAGQLMLDQRHSFQVALFRVLAALAGAGVVHGGIDPAVVHWDGRDIQLTGFYLAAVAGEPYRVGVASPWMPARASARREAADPRDDVWAAGLVVAHVVTGQPVQRLTADRLRDGSSLGSLLDGVFADKPAERPTPAQILRRLGDHQPGATRVPPDDPGLTEGRAAFDVERAKKHADASLPDVPSAKLPPGPDRRPVYTAMIVVLLLGLAALTWWTVTS